MSASKLIGNLLEADSRPGCSQSENSTTPPLFSVCPTLILLQTKKPTAKAAVSPVLRHGIEANCSLPKQISWSDPHRPIDGWRRERLQPDHLLLNCPGKYVKADCPPILVPGPYSLEPAIFLQSKIRKAAVPLFYTTWRHHIGTREYGVVLALASEGWRVGLKKWRGGSGRSEQRTMRSFRSLSVSHNTSPSKTPASGVSAPPIGCAASTPAKPRGVGADRAYLSLRSRDLRESEEVSQRRGREHLPIL